MKKGYIIKGNKMFCLPELPTFENSIFYLFTNFTDTDKTIGLMKENYPMLFQSEKNVFPLTSQCALGENKVWVKANDGKDCKFNFLIEEATLIL